MNKKLFLILLLTIFLVGQSTWGQSKPIYLNPKVATEKRVADLLARMTLREKLGQITQIESHRLMRDFWNKGPIDPAWLNKVVVRYGVGSILSGGDGAPTPNNIKEWVQFTNQIQRATLKTRLKIPVLYGIDAVHGHNNVIGATIYPFNLGLAATFNEELARKYASLTADEVAATGINWTFAPVLDVAVDPRWGRTHETLGEDPYLVSVLGVAQIDGFQRSKKVVACAKHFIGYSAPESGLDRHPAYITERDLYEIHLPPYYAAIKANVATVMINSGAVNDEPVHASKKLLNDLLRKKLGFNGLLVSDWEDVQKLVTYHQYAKSLDQALILAYNAGMDLNMVPMDVSVIDRLETLVRKKKIPIARINEAVKRILRLKFQLGLFERRIIDPKLAERIIGSQESKKLARTLAQQSIVLLRNQDNVLPLSKQTKSILVTGPSADSLSRLCGGWTINWQGADEAELSGQTVLEAIRKKVDSDSKITYFDQIHNANKLIQLAKAADQVVVVVGEKPYAEQEGDNPQLRLSLMEEKLLTTLQDNNISFVLVVVAGRPLILPKGREVADAVIWAFLPGTEGGNAIADVLFGDYNPSGRLPITFPSKAVKFPVAYYYRENQTVPLYDFGYGLSYTTFKYSNLRAPIKAKAGNPAEISVTVKNTGELMGEEVVLLYLQHNNKNITPLRKTLQGFKRVSLEPGEEKTVSFKITADQRKIFNVDKLQWVEEPGEITVKIGDLTRKILIE